MIKNELNIQTISTKRTGNRAENVLLCTQITLEKEKGYPLYFFKFLLAKPSQNQKSRFFQTHRK
jgi:hypothetical protein